MFVCAQDTRLRVVEGNLKIGARLSIINPGTGDHASHVFIAETPDLLQDWHSALLQHIYDQSTCGACGSQLGCCSVFLFCFLLLLLVFFSIKKNYRLVSIKY